MWMLGRRLLVHGPSMEPAYPDGRGVWASAWPYLFRRPARFDVVVVRSAQEPRLQLKRIVGLPRERVAWVGDEVRINGASLREPYARRAAPVPGDDEVRMVELGPQDYFLAGDNRLYSRDSRRDGPIPRAAIFGKVLSRPAAQR
jgi:signal peptidase I